MNNPTNQLEEILLKKEITNLNAEIAKGMEIIGAAFKKYGLTSEKNGGRAICVSKEDLEKFHEYVNHIKIATSYYYGGDWFHPVNPAINLDNPPNFVKKVLAKYAVEEFMARMDQIEEVRYIAEQALHQSQGN